MAKATFAAGCFWGVEDAFRQVPGVTSTTVGYTGGTAKTPNYKEVCTGRTGHAEAVEVEFDPAQVSYLELLAVFWKSHDPTTMNRQGPDVGTQYRSAIFYHDAEQEEEARASKAVLEKDHVFKRPIVTEIVPAGEFHRAEEFGLAIRRTGLVGIELLPQRQTGAEKGRSEGSCGGSVGRCGRAGHPLAVMGIRLRPSLLCAATKSNPLRCCTSPQT